MTPTAARVASVPRDPSTTPEWSTLIDRAVADGIVSSNQADRLRKLAETTLPDRAIEPGGRVRAHVAEALGYVGAALVLVAAAVTAQQFWEDLAPWVHTALLGSLAVMLLAAGAVARGETGTPLGRLGGFLWLAGVVAIGGTASVVAEEIVELEEAAVAVATFAPATAVALILWAARRRSVQELAVVAGIIATSTSLLALADVAMEEWGGLLVWAIGVAWLMLAWSGVVRPVRTGRVAGAVATLLGPVMAFGATGRWSVVLGLVTASALVAASVPSRETVFLGLGVLGLFVFVPRAVFEFFGEELGAPLALLASGGVLLGVSLWIARTRHGDSGPG